LGGKILERKLALYYLGDIMNDLLHEFENWARCFYALMLKAHNAEIRYIDKVEDPILKSVLMIVAMDHLKVAKTLEMLFDVSSIEVDPFSTGCESVLGRIQLERIRKASSILRSCGFEKQIMDEKSLEELSNALEQLNDIIKGVIEAIADILERSEDLRSRILRHLSIIYEQNKNLFLAFKKRGLHVPSKCK